MKLILLVILGLFSFSGSRPDDEIFPKHIEVRNLETKKIMTSLWYYGDLHTFLSVLPTGEYQVKIMGKDDPYQNYTLILCKTRSYE